jgi:hypothetical protein
MMIGLEAYVDKTDDRPWCNPATWLNEGRWDDQPAAKPQSRDPMVEGIIRGGQNALIDLEARRKAMGATR